MIRWCAWIHPEQAKAKKAIAVPLNDEALTVIREQKRMFLHTTVCQLL
jgi:hypothetical protein